MVSQKSGTVNINGGTIEGDSYGVYAATNASVKITAGKISGGRGITILKGSKLEVTVESTQITGTAKAGVHSQNANCSIYISAGTINGATHGVYLDNGPSAVIDGTAQITGALSGIAVFGGPNKVELKDNDRTKLTVSGNCAINGAGYGITGNGSADGTVININGGKITSGVTAIYHPQVGDMTITGGEITGQNGVQFTGSGNLTVTGGDITATLNYSVDIPEKDNSQSDGTIADGAAISMVSRGGGWQNEGDTMNVLITGGSFTSTNNAAVAAYCFKKADGSWGVGEDNYLQRLNIEGGTFTGNAAEKDILYIGEPSMTALNIIGGYYNQDIDDTTVVTKNYVAETYAAHLVKDPAEYFHVHQPNFYANGEYGKNATSHWQGCKGDNFNCTEGKVVEEHKWDDGKITLDPTYTSEGERTFTCSICGWQKKEPIPRLIYVPGTSVPNTPIEDPDVPLGPDPGLPEDPDNPDNPVIDDPDVPLGPAPDLSDEDGTVIDDPDTPLNDSPKTGDNAQLWWILILIASTGMLGLTVADKRRKN